MSRPYIMASTDTVLNSGADTSFGNHVLGIKTEGTLTAGTLTIRVKAPGSSVFEIVPDGVIDLTNIKSVLFSFVVSQYEFTLSGIVGSDQITITDSKLVA